MKTIILIAILILNGCNHAMSPKEIRDSIDECNKYDLDHIALVRYFIDPNTIVAIRCKPRVVKDINSTKLIK